MDRMLHCLTFCTGAKAEAEAIRLVRTMALTDFMVDIEIQRDEM